VGGSGAGAHLCVTIRFSNAKCYLPVSYMSTPEVHIPSAPPFADAQCEETPTCARDRIFQAARSLFYRFGIRGVSVDQIACEAATTKVTLYRVFSSKDDLVVQVLEDHTRRFWHWWDAVVAPFEGRPRQQIEALFDALRTEMCTQEAERGCPLANAAVEIVDDEHPARRVIHAHSAAISERLRAMCRGMGAAQPDKLGDALTLLIEGVFAARIVFDNTQQVQAVRQAAQALLDCPAFGVAPDPESR
jgi:AcrR family transcriptional regulator